MSTSTAISRLASAGLVESVSRPVETIDLAERVAGAVDRESGKATRFASLAGRGEGIMRLCADRLRIAAAIDASAEGFVIAMGARVRNGGKPATSGPAFRRLSPDAFASAFADGMNLGGIVMIAVPGGEKPLVGLVELSLSGKRFAVAQLPWRVEQTLMGAAASTLRATVILGVAPACCLGAALAGWRGYEAWSLAAALGNAPIALTALPGGLTVPSDAAMVAEGTLTRVPGTADAGWTFVPEQVSGGADGIVHWIAGGSRCSEVAALEALATEIAVAEHLRQVEGGLDVIDVRCFTETDNRLVVVKLRPRVMGQSKTACMAALSSADIGPRIVVAVDDDIDPTDLREVSWSFASRLHAEHDVAVIEGLPAPASTAEPIAPALKWFVDSTMPALTQTAMRADFARATPKNLATVRLQDFLPD